MKIKKIVCGVLACVLALSMLAGCGKGKNESKEGVLTATDIAIAAIADSKLTDDEMLDVVKEYYGVFNSIFEVTGDNIVAEVVKNSDGSVAVNTTRPEVDENGQPTGKTITDEAIFSWGSVKEAFAYLYEQEQVDLEGNLMFSKEDILAQMTQPAPDESAASENPDGITEDAADSEVSSDVEPVADADSALENTESTSVAQ